MTSERTGMKKIYWRSAVWVNAKHGMTHAVDDLEQQLRSSIFYPTKLFFLFLSQIEEKTVSTNLQRERGEQSRRWLTCFDRGLTVCAFQFLGCFRGESLGEALEDLYGCGETSITTSLCSVAAHSLSTWNSERLAGLSDCRVTVSMRRMGFEGDRPLHSCLLGEERGEVSFPIQL